jgi:hypothetical protein
MGQRQKVVTGRAEAMQEDHERTGAAAAAIRTTRHSYS